MSEKPKESGVEIPQNHKTVYTILDGNMFTNHNLLSYWDAYRKNNSEEIHEIAQYIIENPNGAFKIIMKAGTNEQDRDFDAMHLSIEAFCQVLADEVYKQRYHLVVHFNLKSGFGEVKQTFERVEPETRYMELIPGKKTPYIGIKRMENTEDLPVVVLKIEKDFTRSPFPETYTASGALIGYHMIARVQSDREQGESEQSKGVQK